MSPALVGGAAHDGPGGGHYVKPTLLTGATRDMRIAQDEVFGPVLTCLTFKDEAEALADRQLPCATA